MIDGRFDPKAAAPRAGTSPEDPWWEVDLGSLHPLTRIVVRHTSGILGDRLKNFRVVVLDDGRKEVFSTEAKADSSLTVELPLLSEAGRQAVAVRRAALESLARTNGARAPAAGFAEDFPREGVSYTVQKGDTLAVIARKTGARAQDIINANKLADPSRIQAGQVLFIPGGK